MNIYSIARSTGATAEVEAAYLEREGDDWVFYVGQEEVFRVAVEDIVGITRMAQ
jgi:hypothetical protein